MKGCVYWWIDGWMDRWIYWWIDGWMDEFGKVKCAILS